MDQEAGATTEDVQRAVERLGEALALLEIGVTGLQRVKPGNGLPDAVRVGVMSAGDADVLAGLIESDARTRVLARRSVERIVAEVAVRGVGGDG